MRQRDEFSGLASPGVSFLENTRLIQCTNLDKKNLLWRSTASILELSKNKSYGIYDHTATERREAT